MFKDFKEINFSKMGNNQSVDRRGSELWDFKSADQRYFGRGPGAHISGVGDGRQPPAKSIILPPIIRGCGAKF